MIMDQLLKVQASKYLIKGTNITIYIILYPQLWKVVVSGFDKYTPDYQLNLLKPRKEMISAMNLVFHDSIPCQI